MLLTIRRKQGNTNKILLKGVGGMKKLAIIICGENQNISKETRGGNNQKREHLK